ncbi:hypothetical protein BTH42_31665 [Burkholderia sp. SRS-W-2-2016]|uniref:hypothetical protein n=1 Tax=Burkholderia sp. SRS-W-2-2016 TaxID=1926878 RepID=UPI00094B2C35|nr:hypothetical protein [Burkholderia sp. SRS-W-2-2016]OLL27762.1 hypothetical protein BTH42_31665 [Burkholderia sp. SRS-W-2-2016]
MANAGSLLNRVLAELFPGKSVAQPTSPSPEASAPAAPVQTSSSHATGSGSVPHEIGQGAANETVVLIGDTPHLFVDEGDHIVEFVPAFDDHTEETEFGLKIVPDLAPHWSQVASHRCTLKAAISTAIRGYSTSGGSTSLNVPKSEPRDTNEAPTPEAGLPASHMSGDEDRPARGSATRARVPRESTDAAVTGRILSWGEERFPDRNKPGRFYNSFAMHIDTTTGERTLQGEGLKDAIAECRCVVGDVVSVRRLRKIKVPAFRSDGSPVMVDGKQALWDKWLWSITK